MSDPYKLLADHYYDRGPAMYSLSELQRDSERKMRETMYVNPVFLMPKGYIGIDLAKPDKPEKKMSLPISLLVTQLRTSQRYLTEHKEALVRAQSTVKSDEAAVATHEQQVSELTKALKKLGHKA